MSRDKITGIFLFILGLVVFLKSLSYPLGSFRRPGGGLFPLIASILLMGLSASLAIQAFWRKKTENHDQPPFFPEKVSAKRVILGFVCLLAYRYLLPLIGFAFSTGIFIFLLSKFLGRYSWLISVVFAFITAVGAYFLFQVWLKIPMPRPVLGI